MNIIKMVGSMSKEKFINFFAFVYNQGWNDALEAIEKDIPYEELTDDQYETILKVVVAKCDLINLFEEAE